MMEPCPYPGAVPLSPSQSHLLVGRQEDVADLLYAFKSKKVLCLSAESGVGKSSFLKAGLIPELQFEGLEVGYFDSWSALSGRTPLEQLCTVVHASLNGGEPLPPDTEPRAYLDNLERTWGRHLIVIIDQLEELFRLDRNLGVDFLLEVAALYSGSRPYSFRMMLSLRSEFADEFKVLENALDHGHWLSYPLSPIDPSTLTQLVVLPLESTPVSIAPADAQTFVRSWLLGAYGLVEDVPRKAQPRLGLLQLQSLLWVLWHMNEPERGDILSLDALGDQLSFDELDLTGTESTVDRATRSGPARDLYQRALRAYLDLQVGLSAVASADHDIVQEHRWMVARIAPLLSSGDYKLVLNTDELFSRAVPGADDLDLDPSVLEALLREARVPAPLESGIFDPQDPKGDADRLLQMPALHRYRSLLDARDSSRSSAGRLLGESDLRIAAELVVTYERALRWMASVMLVRFSPGNLSVSSQGRTATHPYTSGTHDGLVDARAVSLTHDGFGIALRAYGEEQLLDQEWRIGSVTALAALGFALNLPVSTEAGHATHDGTRIIENLRWVSCRVRGRISQVVFRNCDFSATMFDGCTLEDVVFEDCTLWGVLFSGCPIGGEFGVQVLSTARSRANRVQSFTGLGLTFTSGSSGIEFAGVHGYGVYLEYRTDGALTVRDSQLEHVTFDSVGTNPTLKIVDSEVVHLSVKGPGAQPDWLDFHGDPPAKVTFGASYQSSAEEPDIGPHD